MFCDAITVDNAVTVMVTGLATIRSAPRYRTDAYTFNGLGLRFIAVPVSLFVMPLFSFSRCFS
jgi:hypothetical protein